MKCHFEPYEVDFPCKDHKCPYFNGCMLEHVRDMAIETLKNKGASSPIPHKINAKGGDKMNTQCSQKLLGLKSGFWYT